jgi:RimJ/RimL family protein N-acetyltransferase
VSPYLPFEAERLLVRPFREDDFEDLFALYSDPVVMRFLGGVRSAEQTREKLASMIDHERRHGFSIWALVGKPDGRFVGRCGFWYMHDPDEAELAYTLAQCAWGRGLATEAAEAAVRVAFQRFGLPSLVAFAEADNVASRRVMVKLGMQLVGTTQIGGREAVKYRLVNSTTEKV